MHNTTYARVLSIGGRYASKELTSQEGFMMGIIIASGKQTDLLDCFTVMLISHPGGHQLLRISRVPKDGT